MAEKRWEMQTPENVQMPCLVPPGIDGSVAEQRLRAELQVAFPGKENPILYQLKLTAEPTPAGSLMHRLKEEANVQLFYSQGTKQSDISWG